MIFCNEQLLQGVTSYFLQLVTFATSNDQTLQRVTSNEWISTINEQGVKNYASCLSNIITCVRNSIRFQGLNDAAT